MRNEILVRHRELGLSGLSVSEIGYGGWGIGGPTALFSWRGTSDEETVRALHHAIDLGVNFIDTARMYGDSERLIGQVVRERPGDEVFVATKASAAKTLGPAVGGSDPDEDFSAAHIRVDLESSLSASGLDHFDLFQFHIWHDDWMGHGQWMETVADLKKEGKIRLFGVSVNDNQPDTALAVVRSGVVDVIQVAFNIFEQAPLDELLPACQEHGVGVAARVPFDEGALTGRITPGVSFPEGDFRNYYFRDDRPAQVQARVAAITADLGITVDELPEYALRFVLSHPAVSTVIPGMRSIRNVDRNTAVSDGRLLTEEQLSVLARHRWPHHFYG